MKTTPELRIEERAADRRLYLCAMRSRAMSFRQAIAADDWRNLVDRGIDGVRNLEMAISYRDMARNLGKWAVKQVVIEDTAMFEEN